MIDPLVIRGGLRLYLWQALLGLVIYALAHLYFKNSLPPADLDGSLTSEVLSDWWRTTSGDLSSHIAKLVLITAAYLAGYWYWLSKYLQDISGNATTWSWMRLAIIGAVQLVMTLVLIAIPCLLVATLLGDPTQAVSERPFLLGITGASIVGTALAVAIGVPLIRTKYLLASTNIGLRAAIKDGYTYSRQRSRRHLGIVLTALLVTVVLLWISSRLPSIGSSSIALIILSTVIYQVVMLARCMLRSWTIYQLSHNSE